MKVAGGDAAQASRLGDAPWLFLHFISFFEFPFSIFLNFSFLTVKLDCRGHCCDVRCGGGGGARNGVKQSGKAAAEQDSDASESAKLIPSSTRLGDSARDGR